MAKKAARTGLRRPAKTAENEASPPKKKTARKAAVAAEETPKKAAKKAPAAKKRATPLPKQPAGIKRLKDNDAYLLAVMDRMNGTGEDNMALSHHGATSLSNVVMPIPLILQIVTQINGLPFSSVIEIAGDKGTGKSSLLLGLVNIINGGSYVAPNYSGWCDYMSAETKLPEALIYAICGYPDELHKYRPGAITPVKWYECDTMNDWQKKIQERIKAYGKLFDEDRQVPLMIGIDSISAKLMQESYDKIEKDGYVGRAFSIEAQAIKKFLSKISGDMNQHPMLLVAINHVARDKEPGQFQPTRHKPGGRYMGYQELFDIDVQKAGSTQKRNSPDDYDYPHIHTNSIYIKVEKSSIGETGRKTKLMIDWTYERPEPDMYKPENLRQRSTWMWGRALAHHLSDKNQEITGRARKLLKGICDITADNALMFKCKQIGRNKSMDGEKLGQLIEQDEQMTQKLQDLFAINRYDVFEPMTSYAKARKRIIEEKAAKER